VSFDQVEAAIDAIIRDAGTKAPLPQAFERAKTVLVADAIYSRDSQDAMANDYGAALVVGLTTKDVEEWPDRIKAVSAARMQEAARRYLIKSESATGRLSPQPAAVPATAGASPAEGAP
jgi:zinc protease